MPEHSFLFLRNGSAAPWDSVPELPFAQFRREILDRMNTAVRLEAFFAVPETDGSFRLTAVLGDSEQHGFLLSKSRVRSRFESLTAEHPAFNRFEREIHELHGLVPLGHPWLKPLRFPRGEPGVTDYFTMQGDPVHEVAVGPVHAGVIEPGHFRFECMGETVYSLEISLGYQHRGVEKLLIGGPDARTPHLIETAAGDSSIAAALNYAQIMEALGNVKVDAPARKLRQIALELERCANHIGDLGALAGDVAFLPAASFCGRIRGEYLNMTAELCGNRFGRNFIAPGGVRQAVGRSRLNQIRSRLDRVSGELWNALDLMFDAPTVLDRFENTGTVSAAAAGQLGMAGLAARASGLDMDARRDFPVNGADAVNAMGEKPYLAGDVLARARMRYLELRDSHDFLFRTLADPPECPAAERGKIRLMPEQIALSVTEAWRGENCLAVLTGPDGKIRAAKLVDVSFHNWEGLALALRDEQISNFPICNKSFNLSYCGHDL